MTAHVRCSEHGQMNPCGGCASDHLTGEHVPGEHRGTCRKCRAPRRDTDPDVARAARRATRARRMPDFAALAANDLEEN